MPKLVLNAEAYRRIYDVAGYDPSTPAGSQTEAMRRVQAFLTAKTTVLEDALQNNPDEHRLGDKLRIFIGDGKHYDAIRSPRDPLREGSILYDVLVVPQPIESDPYLTGPQLCAIGDEMVELG